MISNEIRPITMIGFRPPTEVDEAISETLKMCGVYGEEASMIHMEVKRKIEGNNFLPSCHSTCIPTQKCGRWVHEEINCYSRRTYCSECGEVAPFICVADDHFGNEMHGETRKTRFCPNCGADMRGEILFEEVGKPKQPWIPCSERLPEEDVEVLIAYKEIEDENDTTHTYIDITTYGDFYLGGRKIEGHKYWRPPFAYFESNYKVVAWMPLPEPYQEDERDG